MAKPLDVFSEMEEKLSVIFGSFYAEIEGYLFLARVESHKMKLYVVVYIDNHIKGNDCKCVDAVDELTGIPLFFHYKKTKWIYSAAKRAAFKKKHGAKACKEYGIDKSFISTAPFFPSSKSLVTELKKHFRADQVVRLSGDEYRNKLEANNVV